MFVLFQETERYENPHKAYTYNIRSIESTVGPVKVGISTYQYMTFIIVICVLYYQGIYKKDQGNHSKVREHFLLKSSRPHYVTILSIGQSVCTLWNWIWAEKMAHIHFLLYLTYMFIAVLSSGYKTIHHHKLRNDFRLLQFCDCISEYWN